MRKTASEKPLLEVKGLKQYFTSRKFTVRAVDGVDFVIYPGETYGLVGESGSGKSTIGRGVIRLYDPTGGTILFGGMDISGRLSRQDKRRLRTEMQMIFQDPMACLNPRKKVGDIIAEGLDIHHLYRSRAERHEKVAAILQKVGLAAEHAERYPISFPAGSGSAWACPGADHEPEADYRGRVHLRAGRFHPGPGGEPDEGPSAGNRLRLPVHRPRPFHGQVYFRPHRRAALRASGGNRHEGRDLRKPGPPVHKSLLSAIPCPTPRWRKNASRKATTSRPRAWITQRAQGASSAGPTMFWRRTRNLPAGRRGKGRLIPGTQRGAQSVSKSVIALF